MHQYHLKQEGFHPDASKVQALAQWPTPQSTLALKSFLSGINFYRKFIPHFSQLSNPIHHLVKSYHFYLDSGGSTPVPMP
jgi:hypothetical protein